jgi:hypothetical protein
MLWVGTCPGHYGTNTMSLILTECKFKKQQGLSPGQELWKVFPNDDCFEHLLHSVHGSADHWPRGGMFSFLLLLLWQ